MIIFLDIRTRCNDDKFPEFRGLEAKNFCFPRAVREGCFYKTLNFGRFFPKNSALALTQNFVAYNSNGGCQIERTYLRMRHRNGNAEVFKFLMYIIGATGAFVAE